MKNLLLLTVLLVCFVVTNAQSDMILRKGSKGFYLEHKVAAKENFYSIGRIYNAHPKEIAAFNNLDMTKGLSLGQVIQIPLAANFSQTVNGGMPVYYKVGEKEGLMKVSAASNNVSLATLRTWNKLESDNINVGDKLIVGYLVSTQPTVAANIEKKDQVVVEMKEQNVPPKKEEAAVKINDEKKLIEEPQKKEEAVVKVKEEKQPVKEIVKEQPRMVAADGDGYFKTSFTQQVKLTPQSKNETVTSGIFKTTSGWQDAKYYMLINGVAPGTIVKIVNPSNNKVAYAKVLGEMSGIPQNDGYKIRISNAAASALEIKEDDKFIVKINY